MVRPSVQKRAKINIKVLGEDEMKTAADLLDSKRGLLTTV
jgi:hypothetical protein